MVDWIKTKLNELWLKKNGKKAIRALPISDWEISIWKEAQKQILEDIKNKYEKEWYMFRHPDTKYILPYIEFRLKGVKE